MKLLVFADKAVGLRITQFLLEDYPGDVGLVVTTESNEIHSLVERQGRSACVYESDAGVLSRLGDGFDLGVLAWWPRILKSPLLQVPRLGFVNTHPSLLPHNRGKHYNFWALVEQAPFGVTLHRVDAGVDTGDIVAQEQIPYDWCDTGGSLYDKAQDAMVALFKTAYPVLRTGKLHAVPQDHAVGSYHHSSELDKASEIDLDRMYRGRDLLNLLRARTFEGHPGCWFEDAKARYEISIRIKRVG